MTNVSLFCEVMNAFNLPPFLKWDETARNEGSVNHGQVSLRIVPPLIFFFLDVLGIDLGDILIILTRRQNFRFRNVSESREDVHCEAARWGQTERAAVPRHLGKGPGRYQSKSGSRFIRSACCIRRRGLEREGLKKKKEMINQGARSVWVSQCVCELGEWGSGIQAAR